MNRKKRRAMHENQRGDNWEPFRNVETAEMRKEREAAGVTQPNHNVGNNLYQVFAYEEKDCTHLSIRRLDSQAIRDWRDLQRIKNELCGSHREAMEIYPAESRLVDVGNLYHLWVLPEGETIPFGFNERHIGNVDLAGESNRPFQNQPHDFATHTLRAIK